MEPLLLTGGPGIPGMLGTIDTGLASWIKRRKTRREHNSILGAKVSSKCYDFEMGTLGLILCNLPIQGIQGSWEMLSSMEHNSIGNLILQGYDNFHGKGWGCILKKVVGNLGGAKCQVKSTNQQAGKINS